MGTSGMGMFGVERHDGTMKTPGMAKTVTKYIATMAAAIGEITGDPELKEIGQALGQHLPQEAPPQEMPPEEMEEVPEEEMPPEEAE